MPATGCKGAPKNQAELKDDTASSREEKSRNCVAHKKVLSAKKDFFHSGSNRFKHEQGGRVIFAEFESFRLLNTYVPNNGWKEEESSFQRRRKWDKRMLEFVLKTSDKLLIWCGDLNVSHQDIDVSSGIFQHSKA